MLSLCQKPEGILKKENDEEREHAMGPPGQPCFVRSGRRVYNKDAGEAVEELHIRAA